MRPSLSSLAIVPIAGCLAAFPAIGVAATSRGTAKQIASQVGGAVVALRTGTNITGSAVRVGTGDYYVTSTSLVARTPQIMLTNDQGEATVATKVPVSNLSDGLTLLTVPRGAGTSKTATIGLPAAAGAASPAASSTTKTAAAIKPGDPLWFVQKRTHRTKSGATRLFTNVQRVTVKDTERGLIVLNRNPSTGYKGAVIVDQSGLVRGVVVPPNVSICRTKRVGNKVLQVASQSSTCVKASDPNAAIQAILISRAPAVDTRPAAGDGPNFPAVPVTGAIGALLLALQGFLTLRRRRTAGTIAAMPHVAAPSAAAAAVAQAPMDDIAVTLKRR